MLRTISGISNVSRMLTIQSPIIRTRYPTVKTRCPIISTRYLSTTVEVLLHNAHTDERWRNPELWTIDQNASAYEAARLMAAKNIGCVAITDGGVPGHSRGDVVGILTERDFMRKIVVAGDEMDKAAVGEVATMGRENVFVATKSDSVRDCLALIGEVIGLMSMRDLAKQMIRDHRIELRDLFSQSKPSI